MSNPYQRLIDAANAGRGVRLSAVEARILADDGAIECRASILADPETGPAKWAEQKSLAERKMRDEGKL